MSTVPEGNEAFGVINVTYYRCRSCGHIVTMDQRRHTEPTGCGVCSGGGAWDNLGQDVLTLTRDIDPVRGF